MKNHIQLKNILLGGAAVGMFLAPAFAQDQLETVTVTGIRASLQSAQSIKQNSDQVVDSITSVDIGALPDRTVAEALQRVPGVQLVRADTVRDPVRYGGTGNGVFIRGLSWVQALNNGRDAFSAYNGQSLTFSDISANLMSGVDVYKNPNAKMLEGGVGGTVDLKTRKPFDQDGLLIAGSFEYNFAELRGEGSPNADLLFSDRWDTKIGEIGVLLSVDYQDQLNRTNGISGSRYTSQTSSSGVSCGSSTCTTVYVPNDTVGYRQMDWEQTRFAADLAVQWRPSDKLEITATALYSKADPHDREWATSFRVDQTAGSSVADYTYDAAGNWTGGTITGVRPYNFDTRTSQNHRLNADYSLNAVWTPTPSWTVTGDLQYTESRATVRNVVVYTTLKNKEYFNWYTWSKCASSPTLTATEVTLAASTGGTATCYSSWGGGVNYFWANSAPSFDMTMDTSGDTPTMSFTNASAMADKSNYFWGAAMDQLQNSYAKAYAYRLDATHTFAGSGLLGWIKAAEFGFRHQYKDAVSRQTGWNWNVLSLASWNGYGGVPTSTFMSKIRYISTSLSDQVSLHDFGGDFMGQSVPAVWLPNVELLEQDTVALNTTLSAVSTRGSWSSLAAQAGCTVTDYKCMGVYENANPKSDNVNGGINDQAFKIWSGYAMLDFAHDTFLGLDLPVDGNIGVRVVNTKLDISAGKRIVSAITSDCDTSKATSGCSEYDTAQTFSDTGTLTMAGVSQDYTDVMPSFNARVHILENLFARVAYSQAIVRPDISYTQNYTTLSFTFGTGTEAGRYKRDGSTIIGVTGSGGNPYLKPMHVQQYDASLEWYFSPTSSLTFAAFHKTLSGYFYSATNSEVITNNSVTLTFDITRTYNGGKGMVKGWEIGYQQFFDELPGAWSGLGVQANYTKINNTGGVNQTVNVNDTNQVTNAAADLPLEGMSNDSYNLVAMYEKYNISARLAYNWRSGYLLTSSAANINRPIWTNNYGQVDGSIFYTLFEHYKIGVQATNLIKADTTFTVGYSDNHPWYQTVQTDRKFAFIIRGNW